jgi:ABC-type multidrug transport system ATPase subunit
MKGRAAILTTHSMEEADALCHRIGIMVNGRLQCVGTNQHLKAKFGQGYTLEIRYSANRLKGVQEFVSGNFPMAVETESVPGRVSYNMPGGQGVLGKVFQLLEKHKHSLGVEDYSFNQPTLEGVFLSFARRQNDDK